MIELNLENGNYDGFFENFDFKGLEVKVRLEGEVSLKRFLKGSKNIELIRIENGTIQEIEDFCKDSSLKSLIIDSSTFSNESFLQIGKDLEVFRMINCKSLEPGVFIEDTVEGPTITKYEYKNKQSEVTILHCHKQPKTQP